MDRLSTHPGEVISEEFLKPLGLTQVALAKHLDVPVQRVNELVRGKRSHTGNRLAAGGAFETTPDFWINMQKAYDLVAPTQTITSWVKKR